MIGNTATIAAWATTRLGSLMPTDDSTFDNPFDHTSPDLTVFGVDLSNKLYLLLGGVWGVVIFLLAVKLLAAITKFASAKKVQNNPDYLSEASADLKLVAIAFIVTVMVGPIVAGLIGIFNS